MENSSACGNVTGEATMSGCQHRLPCPCNKDKEKLGTSENIESLRPKSDVNGDRDSDSDSSASDDDINEAPPKLKVQPAFRPRGRMFNMTAQGIMPMSTTVTDGANKFMIDVPECWGIAPDGSMMDLFSKAELKDK